MKQIDNMAKKAYNRPLLKLVTIAQPDLICTSDPVTTSVHDYDDELD